MTGTVRVAMWSGPRNLSTAMMRSFGNRPDCVVVDEPFYACWLARTGADHPMRDAVLAAQSCDPETVAAQMLAPVSSSVFYQKQMTHHMLPEFPRGWLAACRHAFLIRAPEAVLASYAQKREAVTLDEIGFRQQREIFESVCDRDGAAPPVIDAADVRAAPEAVLRGLCARLGLPFLPAMLHWPRGRRPTDGVWAPVWYAAVEASEGFAPPETEAAPVLPAALRALADQARPHYEALLPHRIRP